MKYRMVEITERAMWDEFVKNRAEANFLQSWDFYEFHQNRGKKIVRRAALDENDKIAGVYAGVIETARRGTYIAVAGGPLMDFNDQNLVNLMFVDMKTIGRAENCVFVRIRPQAPWNETIEKLLAAQGLKKAPIYLSVEYAGVIDLNKTTEEILANASQGFRRKLRKAEKTGITIETSADPEIVKTFYQLEVKHAKRQGFVAFSEEYLSKQFAAFAKNNEVLMYTAKKDGEILAQNFMIFYGPEASYHYGVSSELGNKYSAAPLLHMAAMEEARKRGCTRYNLWGIVGPEEKKHRFYGVSEFKRSFGCAELKYTPAHDLILNLMKYKITWVIETVRKKIRHV